MSSPSSSSSRYYGVVDGDDTVRAEGSYQNPGVDMIPSSSAPSSSSSSSRGKIVTTVLAVLMAMAGATIMLSYGHSTDLSGGMQFSFYGRPMMGSSTVSAPPTHQKTLTIMKNNDGVGNVIFDYETTSAIDLYKAGETVIECIQVCRCSSIKNLITFMHFLQNFPIPFHVDDVV